MRERGLCQDTLDGKNKHPEYPVTPEAVLLGRIEGGSANRRRRRQRGSRSRPFWPHVRALPLAAAPQSTTAVVFAPYIPRLRAGAPARFLVSPTADRQTLSKTWDGPYGGSSHAEE